QRKFEEALPQFEAAERVCCCLEHPARLARVYLQLGAARAKLGDFDRALAVFERGASLFGEGGQEMSQADCLTNAARCAFALGNHALAKHYVASALATHQHLGGTDAESADLVMRGELALAEKDLSGAMTAFYQAIDVQGKIGHYSGMVRIVGNPAVAALRGIG